MATKTGLNSAYRRAIRDRQDNRRALVIGVALGLLCLGMIVLGNEDTTPALQGQPGEIGIADLNDGPRVHPLVAYAQGLAIKEMDVRLDNACNASGR